VSEGPGRRVLLTVGLTGGIAAGKSAVDALFRELGAHVIDADAIVHHLLAPGGQAAEVVIAAFGPGVAAPDGGVDRAALGAIVFQDPIARARLEMMVHPKVTEEISIGIEAVRDRTSSHMVIVDAALLVETELDRYFDRLVVVACSRTHQVDRLVEGRRMSREEAERRVDSQATSEEKARRADYVIDNDGPLEATRTQVREVHQALEKDYSWKLAGGSFGKAPAPWN
jgi:dephospho-CoA kinase